MEAKREAGITKGLMTKAIEAAAYEAEESMLRRHKQNDTNATSSPLVPVLSDPSATVDTSGMMPAVIHLHCCNPNSF